MHVQKNGDQHSMAWLWWEARLLVDLKTTRGFGHVGKGIFFMGLRV